MNYNVIMATDKYGGYSKHGELPWSIPNELKYFNSITTYQEGKLLPIIIMGRLTWDSLLRKELPDRINIVLSKRDLTTYNKNTIIFNNIPGLLSYLSEKYFYNEKYIIGGHNIINQFFNKKIVINNIYISQINENYECDQFLNISDHLLKYNSMNYSRRMHDKYKNKEVNIVFKKFYLKEIEFPEYDIFYKYNNKIKLLRIYQNDTKEKIKKRVLLSEQILNLLDGNIYTKLYHGKYI
jgi:dihydrofolate reductase